MEPSTRAARTIESAFRSYSSPWGRATRHPGPSCASRPLSPLCDAPCVSANVPVAPCGMRRAGASSRFAVPAHGQRLTAGEAVESDTRHLDQERSFSRGSPGAHGQRRGQRTPHLADWEAHGGGAGNATGREASRSPKQGAAFRLEQLGHFPIALIALGEIGPWTLHASELSLAGISLECLSRVKKVAAPRARKSRASSSSARPISPVILNEGAKQSSGRTIR